MRILILGGDGYLGWPTAMHFSKRGHEVHVVDNYLRRRAHEEAGTDSLTPIAAGLGERVAAWKEVTGLDIGVTEGDLTDWAVVEKLFRDFRPEAVIHYGEMPCAPYSMKDREHAVFTQQNNVINTLNVLLAMQRFVARVPPREARHHGRVRHAEHRHRRGLHRRSSTTGAPTPCRSPSCPARFYHCSKVHDSPNIHFACRVWGLRATDLNQGVVYGIETEETKLDPRLLTRFDYDEVFGTALNRFCLQAVIGHPLTAYGKGGQTRGYLNIVDTLACVELAVLNPADGRRVPRLQPVHRAVLHQRAGRAGAARRRRGGPGRRHRRTSRTRGSSWRSTTTTPPHQAARARAQAAPALRDAGRVGVRRDRAATATGSSPTTSCRATGGAPPA